MPASGADPGDRHRVLGSTLERVVFFSDAVFAIAITLLALDLRLPELPPGQTDASLLDTLSRMWPSVYAFVLSFVVIAAFWLGHYRTFRHIIDIDGRLIAINFGLLFCIVLLPFPTSVLAAEGDLSSAAVLYAGFGVATGIASTVLWVYPARIAHLMGPEVTPAIARGVTIRAAITPAVFAASIPVALVMPAGAWVLWFLAPVLQAVVSRRFRLRASDGADLRLDR
jgi:uncharacterized membrane protein